MFEIEVFFENQVKECNLLAERASDESEREFWLRAAHRWGALLGERRGPLDVDVRLEHPYRRRKRFVFEKAAASRCLTGRNPLRPASSSK